MAGMSRCRPPEASQQRKQPRRPGVYIDCSKCERRGRRGDTIRRYEVQSRTGVVSVNLCIDCATGLARHNGKHYKITDAVHLRAV